MSDRLYIACPVCNEAYCFAKTFGEGYTVNIIPKPFLDKHEWCGSHEEGLFMIDERTWASANDYSFFIEKDYVPLPPRNIPRSWWQIQRGKLRIWFGKLDA